MFLERLEVENIRSISEPAVLNFLDLSSNRPAVRRWSLLAGENGTGKSTLLKAAGLLLGGSNALPHLIGNCGAWVRRGAPVGRISARLRTAEWELREVALEIAAGDTLKDVLARNAPSLARLDEALDKASQNYFVAAYGPYRRVSDETNLPISNRGIVTRALAMMTLFDKDAVVNPLTTWAMSLEYRRGDEGLGIVREAMNALLPGVEFVGIDKEAGALRFDTADGIVELEELSDGYQNMAAWIGDLLYRVTEAFAHYRQPLNARGLLLIDEIDAHLHPGWQRRLRQFLSDKLPNFQIVATTHSALTLQQAHEGEASILSRDERRVVQLQEFPGDPSKLRLHQLYDLAFRIGSSDSWEIEQSKSVYRELSVKPDVELTDEQRVQLKGARAQLEALPDDRDNSLGDETLERYFAKLDEIANSVTSRLAER